MELERLLSDPRMMQAVLGMGRDEFARLVPVLEQVWQQVLAQRPDRQRAVGALPEAATDTPVPTTSTASFRAMSSHRSA